MNFTVAIVGRPNVGKSTLFNRLVGKKLALVDDTPGVTRDRRPGDAKLVDLRFTIIDTAGLEQSGPETLQGRMWLQTEAAIEEADLTLFVVDAKYGLTPADETLGKMLRRRGKPVVLVANKSEAKGSDGGYYDAFTLGLGEPVAISAEHGQGMIDLRDAIVAALGEDRAFPPEIDEPETNVDLRGEEDLEDDDYEPEYDDTKPLRVAIIGRPNAGKSTLINRFLGEDRLLTGPEAGITRDSISVEWDWRGRTIKMFDTAGMRKKARVQEKLEKLSVADSLRSIRFAESVVIVFDATIPFEKQDLQLVDLVAREGR
ncbi:ribosome biogenesis GTPase Der, partial [Pararhizobium sp.]